MARDDDDGDDAGLFSTTRGKLLLLLCRGPRTVNELAEDLDLTDNAVRAQLATLQDNELVRQIGFRPGTRKPHAEYELTPKARRLFPQAHELVLNELLGVLRERLPRADATGLLKEVAKRVLGEWIGEPRAREPRRRLAEFYKKISALTDGVSLEQDNGRAVVRACGCPLASVTARHPEVCAVLAEVLSEILGAKVRERCDRTDAPRCCFQLEDGDAR